jgi:putative membrane protein
MAFFKIFFLAGFAFLALSLFPYDMLVNRGFRHGKIYRAAQILLGLAVLLAHGALVFGWGKTVLFMLSATLVGAAAETLGVTRGWIFGSYHYTDKAGPKLAGVLPAATPLLWGVISYMGYLSACLILRGMAPEGAGSRTLLAGTASVVVLLFDLTADPIAVDEGVWVWKKPGRYFGVPFSNFLGWLFTAAVIFISAVSFSILPQETGTVPPWITFLPAFGYCLFLGICSKVCFERKLVLPGVLGAAFALGLFIIQLIRITA